ncbi:hypothetical protein C8J56DRAFT_357068 [Mycena floridula]|nr:hypothetical protein C8J56DRAFT_357068 [Mycena floridula]
MTPDEEDALNIYGYILYTNFATAGTGFAFYGIYLVLFVACMIILLRQGSLKSRPAQTLFTLMVVLFLSTTMQFIIDFIYVITQVKTFLLPSATALPDRGHAFTTRYGSAFQIVESWPLPINLVISDFIVIWRAWVLVPTLKARIPMAIVAAANAILNLYSTALLTKHAANIGADPTIDVKLFSASVFLSFGTNLLGTGLIAWKGWQHHRLMSSISSKRSQVSNILIILVEGGFAFSIVQLAFSIIQILDVNTFSLLDQAVDILGESLTYLAAIFPTATIIIVRSQRSVLDYTLGGGFADSKDESAKPKTTQLSTLNFADTPGATATSQTQADSRFYDSGFSNGNGDISTVQVFANEKSV